MTNHAGTWTCPGCEAVLPIGINLCKRCGTTVGDTAKPNASKSKAGTLISQPQIKCSVAGCDEDHVIAVIQVMDRGRLRCGLLRDFGHVEKGNYYLHSQYTFSDWMTRCGEHYSADLVHSGKNQLRDVATKDHSYMLNKPHADRMVVLRNLLKGAFRPLPYNPSDDARTIENYDDDERAAIMAESIQNDIPV